MIEIDGSHGEGGGQIVRTALGLSALLGHPFRMVNIRQGRKRPGLMPQHLTCVRAMQLLSGAEVNGDSPGSTELSFAPREIRGGEFSFDIGTAGSTVLLLQALIPALIRADRPSRLLLRGGTHVPFSPSFHYLAEVFAPMLARLGVTATVSAEAYGFYPRGGGVVRAKVEPARRLRALRLAERGRTLRIGGYACVANLPLSIAERERAAALATLAARLPGLDCPVEIEAGEAKRSGPGTFIFLKTETAHALAGFTALGERGRRAEAVGEEVAGECADYCQSGAALDPHLPDQLVPYLALAEGESVFTTSRITGHLLTNLWVTSLFRPFQWSLEGERGGPGRLLVQGTPSSP